MVEALLSGDLLTVWKSEGSFTEKCPEIDKIEHVDPFTGHFHRVHWNNPDTVLGKYEMRRVGNRVYIYNGGKLDARNPGGSEIIDEKWYARSRVGGKVVLREDGNYDYVHGYGGRRVPEMTMFREVREGVYQGKEVFFVGKADQVDTK